MLIKDVFEEFLSEQESRLSPKTYRGYASVIELFEHQILVIVSLQERNAQRREDAQHPGK